MSEAEPGYRVEDAAPPTPRMIGLAIPAVAPDSAVCLQCGYAVRGLDTTHNCPECGAPISRSLMGNLLEFSSSAYVRSLYRGVVMILVAMILQVVLVLLGIVAMIAAIAIASSASANSPKFINQFQMWMEIIMLPITALLLVGWWLFSMPDPAILGAEQGQKPRLIIRITVAITAAMAVLELMARTMTVPGANGDLLSGSAAVLNGLAGTVQFFASVLYVRWLAPRIPDKDLHDQAKKYLWMLPLIYVLGAICFWAGPLVAGVMYLLMLNTVRMRLQAIIHHQPQD